MPLRHSFAYFFISTNDTNGSHPWWGRLYAHLLRFSHRELHWVFDSDQGGYFARPSLSDEDRGEIVALLRTAPPEVVDANRTLRRAIALSKDQEQRLELMYFCGDGQVFTPG